MRSDTKSFLELMYGESDSSGVDLDFDYILSRVQHEGDQFVTLNLSLLGKSLEVSAITNVPLKVPFGFNLMGKTRLPRLFYSLISKGWNDQGQPQFHVDNLQNGAVLSALMRILRQLTLAFSKVEDMDCAQSEDEAADAFRKRMTAESRITCRSDVLNAARKLLRDVLCEGDELHPSLAQWESIPFGRHGPGAVAGAERGEEKWRFKAIAGVDPQIYFWRNIDYNGFYDDDGVIPRVARLCIVPKDFKSKRVICIEQKELQFAQQGLMRVLFDIIHSNPLTGGEIRFDRQDLSAEMCKDLGYSTIDLKDASDSVSLDLARLLLPRKAFLLFTRYRSHSIDFDGLGDIVRHKCLATMGSALCFPLETLIFWAIARGSIVARIGKSGFRCRVFGDDIIIPQWGYADVAEDLESCGFTVNRSKSCSWPSLIRESCGMWTLAEIPCQVVKFHKMRSSTASDLAAIMRQVDLLEDYSSGMTPVTCAAIRTFVRDESLHFTDKPIGEARWNKQYQRKEVWMPILSRGCGRRPLPAFQGLYAWLVGNDTRPCPAGALSVARWGWTAA